jgi:lipopolysaccharide O-acetyltransferase
MTNKVIWKYSPPDIFRLFWSLLITKLFFRKARLIRQPTRIRGYNNMIIGDRFTTGQYCRIEAGNLDSKIQNTNKTLLIGNNVQINDNCHIAAIEKIIIGNRVLIASKVYISDHDHGSTSLSDMSIPPALRPLITAPVLIGDDVWIGESVVILKGVSIGKGSVIGAGAVVTKSFPAGSIIVGVPAYCLNKQGDI